MSAVTAKRTEQEEGTHIATLVRGRVYVYKRIRFDRSVPKKVSSELAEELADLMEYIADSDPENRGKGVNKPLFKIEEVSDTMTVKKFAPPKRSLPLKSRRPRADGN